MSFNDVLESFWWVLNVLKHCELDISISDDICIGFVLLFSFNRSLLVLESRFIKVDFFGHDDRLN